MVYYEAPDGVLFQGDCLEILGEWPGPPVGVVITSPPYNIGLHSGHARSKNTPVLWQDKRQPEEFWAWVDAWLRALWGVCEEGARAYFVVADRMIWRFREAIDRSGWKYVQLMPMCKTNLVCPNGAINTLDWALMTEWIFLVRKGKRTKMLSSNSMNTYNWFAMATPQSNYNGNRRKVHPAQFPTELPRRLLSRTPGEVVLDPFAGAGTTMVAARGCGRRWVGIDMYPLYLDIAIKRIEAVSLPLPMEAARV